MNINIEITKATVLLSNGPDQVTFLTKFPSPFNIEYSDFPLCLEFKASYDTAIEYLKENFNIDNPEIINIRYKRAKFREE